MRNYFLYILIGFLTFGIGSFVVLNLYWIFLENSHESAGPEFLASLSSKSIVDNTFLKSLHSTQLKEVEPAKPFCYDKNILSIWNVLLKDKDFWEWEPTSYQSLDCKDMLEIKKIDLNQDGNKEIILRGKNSNLCSAVGNCAFWIYEKRGKIYRKLLADTDYCDASKLGEQLLKTKTNSYHDILLKGHLSAPDTSYAFYKFDGKKYKIHKNLVEACVVCVGEHPKWKFMTSREYWNSQH